MSNQAKNPGAATTGSNFKGNSKSDSSSKGTENQAERKDLGQILLDIECDLTERAGKEIIKPPVLFSMNEDPIIYKYSITTIKGRKGVTKTKVACIIASAGISDDIKTLAGFKRNSDKPLTVVYIGTEANKDYEFPELIQRIRKLAGFDPTEHVIKLRYTSLLSSERKLRTQQLKAYIARVRKDAEGELLLIFDILTDCITNFNDPEESMKFLDWVNLLMEEQKCTILAVIHQNDTKITDKAMGHLGSELERKSTTVLQISVNHKVRISEVTITPTKTRKTRPPEPIIFKFGEDGDNLEYDEYESLRRGIRPDVLNALSIIEWEGEVKQQQIIDSVIKAINDEHSQDSKKDIPAKSTVKNLILKVIKNKVPIYRKGDLYTITNNHKQEGSSKVAYLKLKVMEIDLTKF